MKTSTLYLIGCWFCTAALVPSLWIGVQLAVYTGHIATISLPALAFTLAGVFFMRKADRSL